MRFSKNLYLTIILFCKINTLIKGETTLIINKYNSNKYKFNILNSQEKFKKKLKKENEYLNFNEYYGKNYENSNIILFKFFKETKEISVNLKSTCYLPFMCVRYSKEPLIDLKDPSTLLLECDIVSLNLIDKTLPDQNINYVLKKSDASTDLRLSFSAVERYLEGYAMVSCLLYPEDQFPILTFSIKYERFLVDTEEVIVINKNNETNFKNINENLLIKKSGSHKIILKNLFIDTIIRFEKNDLLKYLSINFEYLDGNSSTVEIYDLESEKKFREIDQITIFIKNNYFKDIEVKIKISSFIGNSNKNNIFLDSQVAFILVVSILSFFLVLIIIYQFKIMFSNKIDNRIEPQILQIVSEISQNSFNNNVEEDEESPVPIFSVKLKKYNKNL